MAVGAGTKWTLDVNRSMILEVKQTEDKWGLFLGSSLIGTSKHRFDVDFAKQVLTNWKENKCENLKCIPTDQRRMEL